MIDVERVHAENPGDFGVALLQCELRQRSDAKFFRRHFESADAEVVEFCRAHPFRCFASELCRDPRRFRSESERFNETFVQDGDKRAGIEQQAGRLSTD